MGYYSKYTDRMDFHIEEDRGTILIKQKWKYDWLNSSETSSWTYSEKHRFHKKIDSMIYNSWGKRWYLKVDGTSNFSQRNTNTIWDVNFDVEWVLQKEHWKVNVRKVKPKRILKSSVDWNKKQINLDTEDFKCIMAENGESKYYQYIASHEFGHTIGNSFVFNSGDEYKSSSSYFFDKASIMNIGNQIRDRHFWYILDHLNSMIPDTTFIIS